MRMQDIAAMRIRELETQLASERLALSIAHEGHKRDIRALEDMLEAETEARRNAEGEVERLQAKLEAMPCGE